MLSTLGTFKAYLLKVCGGSSASEMRHTAEGHTEDHASNTTELETFPGAICRTTKQTLHLWLLLLCLLRKPLPSRSGCTMTAYTEVMQERF